LDHAVTQPGVRAGTGAFDLCRVTGIRIRIDRSWFIVFLLVMSSLSLGYFPGLAPSESVASHWFAGLLATLLLFGSILLHELAHSWVAMRAGIRVPEITLFLFGGVSRMEQEPKTPAVELRVALAGPLMSFALALLFWLVARVAAGGPWLAAVIPGYLAWINLALGVFNLLPGYPLDGGRVLRSLVWWKTGSLPRATKVTSSAGEVLALLLMILGGFQILSGALIGGLWLFLIAVFIRSQARVGYTDLVLRSTLSDVEVERVMVPRERLVVVPSWITLRELVDDYFLGRGYRGLPVMDDGHPIGLVSTEEVRRTDKKTWDRKTVADVMSDLDERTIGPHDSLLEALKRITQSRYRRLLVMEDGELLGLLSAGSISRFVELRTLLQET
jgi:Zn-dependent protease/predicted transcriptional regulator